MASGVLAIESAMEKRHSFFDSADVQGVRRSSLPNDVWGCRLASALAGTGGTCSATPGIARDGIPETPAAGSAGADAGLDTPEAADATPGNAEVACVSFCNGKVNTTRTGAFIPSASNASRGETDTKTYPCASSDPTKKGRAGFPSTAINAAPLPTLLAMTPDRTNRSDGPGPGSARSGGVAPSSRASAAGLDISGTTAARGASVLMDVSALTTACVQYQPETTTAAHKIAVIMRQPIACCNLNISKRSSHTDAASRKSWHCSTSSRPTGSRTVSVISRGFTLIELMVVLVIIGVLAALIVPNVLDRADDARVMAARTDVNNLNQALKLYKLDNQRLPSTDQGLQALIVRPSVAPVPANWKAYLDKLPNDPWGRPYQYLNPGIKGEVDVMSLGADGQPGGEGRNSDVGSWQ